MLKIRLSRIGKKGQPAFRIVVQEHTASAKGKFIEALGNYRPATDPKDLQIDLDRIKYWLSVGAQPSDAIAVLLKNEGLEGMDKYIAPRDKQREKKQQVRGEAEHPSKTEAPESKKEEESEEKVETPEEAKPEEPKPEEPKAEEPKSEEPKEPEPPKPEEPKAPEQPKPEEPQPTEESK